MAWSGLPATFTYSQARAAGLTKHELYRLRDRGDVEAIGRGLYRQTSAPLADLDLVTIAERASEATLCLRSALAEHGLTDIIPVEHDVALPRGTWHPHVDVPVHWHSFATDTFHIGRDRLALDDDTEIGLYSAPRSIVDVFRMRGAVGADLAYEALRRWLRHGGQPVELLRIAKSFPRATSSLRQALEVLL